MRKSEHENNAKEQETLVDIPEKTTEQRQSGFLQCYPSKSGTDKKIPCTKISSIFFVMSEFLTSETYFVEYK